MEQLKIMIGCFVSVIIIILVGLLFGIVTVRPVNKKVVVSTSSTTSTTSTTISTTKKTTKKKVVKTTKKVSYNKSELKSYAKDLVINIYGWTENDYNCLVNLWNKESGWNPNSHNRSSGAHGIPQALPASKMKSEGKDYYTNGKTQIRWGLKYIKSRYGTPRAAWKHFKKKGWY